MCKINFDNNIFQQFFSSPGKIIVFKVIVDVMKANLNLFSESLTMTMNMPGFPDLDDQDEIFYSDDESSDSEIFTVSFGFLLIKGSWNKGTPPPATTLIYFLSREKLIVQ